MAEYIPSDIAKISKSMRCVVDLTKLGPRQRTDFIKQAKTGALKGRSAPQILAKALRDAHVLPYVHQQRYGYLGYRGLTKDQIAGIAAVHRLNGGSGTKDIWTKTVDGRYVRGEEPLFNTHKNSEKWMHVEKPAIQYAMKLNLGSTQALNEYLAKIESGEIREIQIDVEVLN